MRTLRAKREILYPNGEIKEVELNIDEFLVRDTDEILGEAEPLPAWRAKL